ELPVEVLRHELQHPAVAGELVVGLQAVEHHHVGPQVVLALGALDGGLDVSWTEVTVVPLALEGPLDPRLRFLDLPFGAEQLGAIAKTLEPVRPLLPAALALAGRVEPGVVFFAKERADLAQVTMEARGLELELLAEPPARGHRADRKLE